MTLDHQRAIEEIVDRYTHSILLIATGILRNPENARDICQEVLIRFFERMETIENPGAWLYRATINRSINARKKETRHRERHLRATSEGPIAANPEQAAAKRERRRMLMDAIASLPDGQRSAFLLRQRLEMPIKEIARTLGVSEGTIKKQLNRAVNNLKSAFESERRRGDE